MQLSCRVRDF